MTDFRVFRVLGGAFAVTTRNFGSFFVISLIFYLPLIALIAFQTFWMGDDAGSAGSNSSTSVVSTICYYGVLAAVTYGTIQDLRGTPANLWSCLEESGKSFQAVIGVAFLTLIAVTLGIIALVIPGLFLIVALYFAAPVAVVERSGAWASLRRSFALTKGYRWRIFGLSILAILLGIAPVVAGVAVSVAVAVSMPSDFSAQLATMLITGLALVLSALIPAAMAAVGYHDLRVAKEGMTTAQLAAVFD